MRVAVLIALVVAAAAGLRGEDQLTPILNRVSEEAEVFRQVAPNVIGQETLVQKVRKEPRRFRLRVGDDALEPPPVHFNDRQIVSEYGFSTLEEAPDAVLELRQIVSVDGRKVVDHNRARQTLTLGITNRDDKAKKTMLRRFEKLGLDGAAATDFGQMLLLFRRRNLSRYNFQLAGGGRIGADETIMVDYEQKQGPESLTIFQGREAVHAQLAGTIEVRARDYLPLRITLRTKQVEKDRDLDYLYESSVEYYQSAYGVLLPASVTYRKQVNGELLVENTSTYAGYSMFAVDAAIKFTPADESSGDEPQLATPPPD